MAGTKGGARPGAGRPKGSPNKVTTQLKEAILRAAEESGEDQRGKDGLIGYLRRVANDDVKAFSGLLGKVLPLQVTGEGDGPLRIVVQRFTDADSPPSE